MPLLRRATIMLTALALSAQASGAQLALDRAGHDIGARTAPVEVIEFHDLGCSQCARFTAETFGAIEREFIATGKVRWKSVPFVLGSFRHSAFASEAVECAAEQGKFLPMHDALLAQQGAWKASLPVPHALFARIARGVGVDTAKLGECVRSERMRDRVRAHKALAQQLQVYGTPTFIVQREKRVLGAIPGDQFADFLRKEVSSAQVRAAQSRMARPPQ